MELHREQPENPNLFHTFQGAPNQAKTRVHVPQACPAGSDVLSQLSSY